MKKSKQTPICCAVRGHEEQNTLKLTVDVAGSLNNRAERRDDGLRQDRHSNRNRGTRVYSGNSMAQLTSRQSKAKVVRAVVAADAVVVTRRAVVAATRGGTRALTVTTVATTPASGMCILQKLALECELTRRSDHQKQAAHGWGEDTGAGELADEQAGDAIANAEAKDEAGWAPDTSGGDPAFSNGPGGAGEAVGEDAAAEPEEKTKSYDEYLAEQAEKRLALGSGNLNTRKANEGSKQKFPTGTEVKREAEDFFVGAEEKARKEKQQKDKNRLQLEGQYYAAADSGDRRGGGRGRGGRGRGEGRGEFRGDRGGRGGRGRGEFRGGARGGPRGGGPNTNDSAAFPALGS